MPLPTTVSGVVARLREIDAGLPRDDGVAVFNRVYLTVTARIDELLADPSSEPDLFGDAETMAALDVDFAHFWLRAHDADAAGRPVAPAWRPLFEARHAGRLPIQYALAGMNTHIEHDLPLAVVGTCRARDLEPEEVHRDYLSVNRVLAEVESPIRRTFLDEIGTVADERVGPVVHLISTWNIEKARDVSWVTTETLWALAATTFLRDRFADVLGDTVAMTSRALLSPV